MYVCLFVMDKVSYWTESYTITEKYRQLFTTQTNSSNFHLGVYPEIDAVRQDFFCFIIKLFCLGACLRKINEILIDYRNVRSFINYLIFLLLDSRLAGSIKTAVIYKLSLVYIFIFTINPSRQKQRIKCHTTRSIEFQIYLGFSTWKSVHAYASILETIQPSESTNHSLPIALIST